MKKILLFASENQANIELIQLLIANRFQVQVFSLSPFKNQDIKISASPLQLSIDVVNIANHYNWRDAILRCDCAINTLSHADFKISNQSAVYANFTHHFAESTRHCNKPAIFISLNHIPQVAHNSELAMLKVNPFIFFAKTALILDCKSMLIISILNSSVLFLSPKMLKINMPITPNTDILSFIINTLNGKYFERKTLICSETFTFNEIRKLTLPYRKSKHIIVKMPHFLLKFILFFVYFLPKKCIPLYLYSQNISNIFHSAPMPNYPKYSKYTLLSKMIELHSKNFFKSEIE